VLARLHRTAGGATLALMPTLLRDPLPGEVQELLLRRRQLGQDHKDEVWDGVLHVVPAPEVRHARISQQLAVILDAPARAAGLMPAMAEFNLGDSETDYRVPDGGLLHPDAHGVWLHTAPLVVEIVSPGDQTWEKLPFYAAHEVDEILIVDPEQQQVHWLALAGDGRYEPIQSSRLIALGQAELQAAIHWPAGAQS
jgi:Uma2 family endonuclease